MSLHSRHKHCGTEAHEVPEVGHAGTRELCEKVARTFAKHGKEMG